MKTCVAIIFLMILMARNVFAQGSIVLWDESVNGSLGQSAGNATSLDPVQLGINSIIGNVENEPVEGGHLRHEDYFIFTVPANLRVDSIQVTINRPNVAFWIGSDYSTQLGYTENAATGELLSQWQIGSIGSGSYSMYVANGDGQSFTTIANYRLDFSVTAVPEPSTISLAVIGVAFMLFYRCKGRRAT